MKTSKRNLRRAAMKAERRVSGKPRVSRFEAKQLRKLGIDPNRIEYRPAREEEEDHEQ